jgi:hypothetical protein
MMGCGGGIRVARRFSLYPSKKQHPEKSPGSAYTEKPGSQSRQFSFFPKKEV